MLMKRLLLYAFMLSILAYSVLAADANVYEAADFTAHPEQLIILEERDLVRINWAGKEHQVVVGKIYLDQKKVDLTAFIEGSEVPYYVTINLKTSLQLDFDQDGEYDLKVYLFNIIEDEGKKIAALKFEKIEKQQLQEITAGTVIEKKPNGLYQYVSKNKLYILIGLVLLGLGVWKRKIFLRT